MAAQLGDRSLFPSLEAKAFLAHASIAPLSEPVRVAMTEVIDDYTRKGVGAFAAGVQRLRHLRGQLATLVGAEEDEIALVPNTTQGVIDVAFGIRWKSGDRVVLFEDEFPANVTPWQRAADTFGLELAWCPLAPFLRSHEEGLAALADVLEQGARVVAVSAVQFKSGLRMPLREIADLAHERGAEVFVDGIQATGGTPIDVGDGIDYMSGGSHKWLMGPEGGGFLYVSRACCERLEPRLAGWLSHENAEDFLFMPEPCLSTDKPFKRTAGVFEIGTQNMVGFAGLDASVSLLLSLGVEAIHAHVNRYLDVLEAALVAHGLTTLRSGENAGRSTLLSMAPPSGHTAPDIAARLRETAVVCNTPDGLLRFSPHWPNDLAEVNVVADAVASAVAQS